MGSNAQEMQSTIMFTNGIEGGPLGAAEPMQVKSSACTAESCPNYGTELVYDSATSSSSVQIADAPLDYQNEAENPTVIGTTFSDRICVDLEQTVCTAETQ